VRLLDKSPGLCARIPRIFVFYLHAAQNRLYPRVTYPTWTVKLPARTKRMTRGLFPRLLRTQTRSPQWIRATKPTVNDFDMCQCKSCKTEQHIPVEDLIATYDSTGTVEPAVQLETQSELTNAIQQPAVQMQLPPVAPPPMHMFFPPPPGWFMPTPNFQPLMCCPRHQEYMRIPGRKGRPPHDHNCFRRCSTNAIVI